MEKKLKKMEKQLQRTGDLKLLNHVENTKTHKYLNI